VTATKAFATLEEVYIIMEMDLPPPLSVSGRFPKAVAKDMQSLVLQQRFKNYAVTDKRQKMPRITILTWEQLKDRAPGI
jgi:hypothetical protein